MRKYYFFFFFSSRRRHTRLQGDWSSDVCSSDLTAASTTVLQTFRPTKRATGKLPDQNACKFNSERGDRVRVVPLGANSLRGAGSLSGLWATIVADCRSWLRGKNGSARPQGTHTRQCIKWRDGETRAILVLHSVRVRALVSALDNLVR